MPPTVVFAARGPTIAEIARPFETRRIKRVPVRNGKLVGIASGANLPRVLARASPLPPR